MDANIIEQMRKEAAALESKLKAVRDLLAVYGGDVEVKENKPQRVSNSPTAVREKQDITSFTSKTRQSVVLAMQALCMTDGLLKTRDLINHIEAMGYKISGKNKVNSLGALLSRSVDIVGHGKSGWSLSDRDKALAIVNKYLPNENEAPEADAASASEVGVWGAATPQAPVSSTHSGWTS